MDTRNEMCRVNSEEGTTDMRTKLRSKIRSSLWCCGCCSPSPGWRWPIRSSWTVMSMPMAQGIRKLGTVNPDKAHPTSRVHT